MWVLIPWEDNIPAFLWAFKMYSWPGRGRLLLIRRTVDRLSQKIQASEKFSSVDGFVASSVAFIIP